MYCPINIRTQTMQFDQYTIRGTYYTHMNKLFILQQFKWISSLFSRNRVLGRTKQKVRSKDECNLPLCKTNKRGFGTCAHWKMHIMSTPILGGRGGIPTPKNRGVPPPECIYWGGGAEKIVCVFAKKSHSAKLMNWSHNVHHKIV